MHDIEKLGPGKRISFEVYPSSIIGNNFKEVYLEGVIDPTLALAHGIDIEAYHAKVYPTLPQGTAPDNAFGYNYVRVRYPNGASEVIGVPWIRPETLQILQGGRIILTFEDKTQSDLDRILQILSANGMSPADVHVEQNTF